ncbi:MAG: hypothetical protein ACK44H_10105 [Candidatus Kryptonium sp.]
MEILVVGPGCPRCITTEKNVILKTKNFDPALNSVSTLLKDDDQNNKEQIVLLGINKVPINLLSFVIILQGKAMA